MAALGVCAAQAGPANLRDGLAQLADLAAAAPVGTHAADLLQQAGLADITTPSAPRAPALSPLGAPRVAETLSAATMDLRLALTLLVQVAGPTDARAVQTAQGPDDGMRALVIQRGTATLADIADQLVELGLQSGESDLTLRVPLVIWEGAALALGPGETLRLSRPDGAFVANFGDLAMQGAAIESVGAPNPHLPRFAPFVATVGSGSFQVSDSRFSGLGFGRTRPFAGFSLMRNTLMAERGRAVLRDSLFDGVVSVVIGAASDVAITGNRIHNARGQGLIVAGSVRAHVVGNLFSGGPDFNAIQVIEGSTDAVVSGNVVLGGGKSGIVVRSFSHRPFVAGNIVWQRAGGGITVERADCANIRGNVVIENTQKGIEVRSSAGSLVQGNRVMANRSAGIWISAQDPRAQTFVFENTLLANSAGLSAATGAQIVLRGNDFKGQFPRFLAGDLALQSGHIAADLKGATPLMLGPSGAVPLSAGLSACAPT